MLHMQKELVAYRVVLLQIKVNVPKKGDDDEEAGDAVICEECGRSDRRHVLLMCTCCDSGYEITMHMHFNILLLNYSITAENTDNADEQGHIITLFHQSVNLFSGIIWTV